MPRLKDPFAPTLKTAVPRRQNHLLGRLLSRVAVTRRRILRLSAEPEPRRLEQGGHKRGLDFLVPRTGYFCVARMLTDPVSSPTEVASTMMSPGWPVLCTFIAALPVMASMFVVPPSSLAGPWLVKLIHGRALGTIVPFPS